jgi:hypothetical protein
MIIDVHCHYSQSPVQNAPFINTIGKMWGIETFAEAIKRLPFQSTLVPIKDGFILQIALPSIDLPHLGRILQRYCDEVRVT